jgi:hypothetical protein
MISSVRWFGAAALIGLAVLGSLTPDAQAQRFRAPPPPPRPSFTGASIPPGRFVNGLGTSGLPANPNFYLPSGMTLNQAAYNTAVIGGALSTIPPYWLGYNPYPSPVSVFGPGSPTATPFATAPTTGTPETNPYYGSNPDGYLTGAAAVTGANGQYEIQIQEARLRRELYRQAAVDTRRKIAYEARYERNNLHAEQERPDRERALALDRARKDPPLTEILSGRALNDLYRHAASQQSKGRPGPEVRLTEDVLKKINLVPPGSRANAGLLKDEGKLCWPLPLQGKEFDDARTSLQRALEDAVQQVRFNNPVKPGTLKGLNADLKRLKDALRASIADLSPSEHIATQRYLRQVGHAVTALSDPKVATDFNQNRTPEGKNVGELVHYMAQNGLEFAPAVPGDEGAYAALYYALAAFDAGVRLARE